MAEQEGEKKEKKDIIVEGKNITDMHWPALQKFIVQMIDELLLERGNRTKTRKECDIMRTCWEHSLVQLEESKARLLKKFLEKDILWDKYEEPYKEKEQEITYQKFILNYDVQYQEKENKKYLKALSEKWEEKVLPVMMEAKTKQALRFDEKQQELKKEFDDAQVEYKNILDEMVRELDDKIIDWRVDQYKRIAMRKRYEDLQLLIRQLCYSEQKNRLVNDLNESHKVNFTKIRSFIRERIEGDTMQIVSLTTEIDKVNEQLEIFYKEIGRYKSLIKEKEEELTIQNKTVNISELKLTTYKQNIDKAFRCAKRIEALNKRKTTYDAKKKELEDEIRRRQEEKQMYMDMMVKVQNDMKTLQEKFFGPEFNEVLEEHKKNLTEFDQYFAEFSKKFPENGQIALKEFCKEKALLRELPFMVTKEIKGHNDFIESAMMKMWELGIQNVPQLFHVTSENFPTGTCPAGIIRI